MIFSENLSIENIFSSRNQFVLFDYYSSKYKSLGPPEDTAQQEFDKMSTTQQDKQPYKLDGSIY